MSDASAKPSRDPYIVQPVFKALKVLTCLAEAGRELRLSEIVLLVKLPKSTVYKYLQTLCAARYVMHDPQGDAYWLGSQAWSLGRTVDPSLRVREIAQPLMNELRDQFGETVNLGVLHGHDVVYLEMAQSRQTIRMQASIGAHDPAYCTALGKAILAFLNESHWLQHVPPQLPARTPKTITTHTQMLEELKLTRERGYALDRGENEEGALCIGAPIRDQDGKVIAALSISAPAYRIDREHERTLARLVVEFANKVSHRLGLPKM